MTATPVEKQFVVTNFAEYRDKLTYILSAQLDHSVVTDNKQFKVLVNESIDKAYAFILNSFNKSRILGLYDNNNLLGFIICSTGKFSSDYLPLLRFSESTAFVECLIIGKEYRKLGYGRTLWDMFIDYCKDNHIKYVKFNINTFDKDSLKVFKRIAPRAKHMENWYTHKRLFMESKEMIPYTLSNQLSKPLEAMIDKYLRPMVKQGYSYLPLSANLTSEAEYSRQYLNYLKSQIATVFIPASGKYGVIVAERVALLPFVKCTPIVTSTFWKSMYAKEILSTTAYMLTKFNSSLSRSVLIFPNDTSMNAYYEKCDLGCYMNTYGYRL